MASRAHLLAGLRTGGPRSSSPVNGDGAEYEGRRANTASPPGALSGAGTLKANAAPFTPGKGSSQPNTWVASEVDGQAAALRMQQAIAAAATSSQRQVSGQPMDLAALYGASQGQPQQQYNSIDLQQQEMSSLIRQRKAQMVQNQMLAQQQQQQMELYRLQAASQQQQHLQQVAAQQRLLLAQMQAEYSQQQQQEYSVQDQRMAVQASLQASLRQRQAEQLYAQLQQQQQVQSTEDAQIQQQQLLQRLQLLQLQAAAMQGMQDESQTTSSPVQSRRHGSPRADSPSGTQQARRDRQASQTAADNATSWRSSSVSLPKAAKSGKNGTPSIVVDDSASEKSEGTGGGSASENETPETSEEDISATGLKVAKSLASLNAERRSPSISARPLVLSQAPRSRAFTAEAKTPNTPPSGSSTVSGASRQPRGPPTEFAAVNFTTRMSTRTRREAMSKLCASPRAASFNVAPRPALVI